MRLSIDHRTRYSFSEPQARVVQLLRMTPLDYAAQTIIDWNLDVNCDARLREGRDGYGNVTTMLYVDGPVEAVELIVRGEVLTDDRGGLVTGVSETLPPSFFLRQTPLTVPDAAIEALSAQLARSVNDPMSGAGIMAMTLFQRIETRAGRTPKSRTAAQTLTEGWGSGRDRAHLLVALARAANLPARFVSGHCLDWVKPGGHKSAHCWAEIYDGTNWVSFDPSTGLHTGESYIRVAIGLDASDATPLSGTRTGGGIEELDVDVRVELSGAQTQ
jgi:transglutaminase-like putative cysteine protease